MEASVLALSMTEAKTFGPYLPDKAMLELCLQKATALWKHMETYQSGTMGINELDYAKGFHPLCEWCDWNFDCPKFNESEFQPEWSGDLQRLEELKQSRKSLDADIDELEQGLKDAYALSDADSNSTGGWINAGSHRFRVAMQAGRVSLDKDKLRAILHGFTGTIDGAEQILSSCSHEGEPFTRLTVSKIKQKEHNKTTALQRVSP